MAILPQAGAEPIPGYQLLERLGTGGYGEVWKATAPGGLTKAVKIIYGHMRDSRAEQEFKALGRIKEVRHPFLLSLERVEIIQDQVFIVTELADQSLHDRFLACRKQGLRGIPRPELLTFLRDAADALDYMNEQYALQHLDIKPQNLLLVGSHIKIADFGLVKDLYGTSTTATGGVTPIYAPPEAFDGRVSRYSDQYSLAIVYEEMLTGTRPFPGTTALQLAAQHTSSPPLLDPLPVHDRPIIGRALAKVPDLRFPSCKAMVEALLTADAAPPPPAPPPVRKPAKPGLPTEPFVELGLEKTFVPDAVLDLPTEATPDGAKQAGVAVGRRPRSEPSIDLETSLAPVGACPTLFLGIGGNAMQVLRRLRRRFHARFGSPTAVPIFRTLLLDTNAAGLAEARAGDRAEAMSVEETVHLPLYAPEHYRAEAKDILRWLDRRWLYGIPRSLQTEGMRPLGRLGLMTHYQEVLARLRSELERLADPQVEADAVRLLGQSLRTRTPRIFVVASIAGGAGSGMLIDIGLMLRKALEDLQLPATGLTAMMLYSTRQQLAAQELARTNAYATLLELNHFRAPAPEGGADGQPPPFEECYLAHLGCRIDEATLLGASDMVAEYLEANATGLTGGFLDQFRMSSRTVAADTPGDTTLRGFGLFRLTFPRELLIDAAASALSASFVSRWREGTGHEKPGGARAEAEKLATSLGLELDLLIQRLFDAVEEHLGELPETVCRRLIASSAFGQKTLPAPAAWGPAVEKLLDELDALLGAGFEVEDTPRAPTALEAALRQRARNLGNDLAAAAEEIVRTRLEKSGGYFPTALLCASALANVLRDRTDKADQEVADVGGSRRQRRRRLTSGDVSSPKSSLRWLRFGQNAKARRMASERFEEYCGARLRELAVENALEVLRIATGRLGALNQSLVSCRQNLGDLVESFTSEGTHGSATRSALAPANLIELLPEHATTMAQASHTLLEQLEAVIVPQFQRQVREEVLEPLGGLTRIALEGRDPIQLLREPLLSRARYLIAEALEDTDAAQLFLTMYADPQKAEEALRSFVQSALPLIAPKEAPWKRLLVTVPQSVAGRLLRERLGHALKGLPVSYLESAKDVSISWEVAQVPLSQVLNQITEQEPACKDMARRILTRTDVAWEFSD